jgi:hypothetical protein
VIAVAVQDMLCRRRDSAAQSRYWSGRRCYMPLRTMEEAMERE